MKTLSHYVLSIVVAMFLVVIANIAFASKMTLPSNLQSIESQAFYQDESIDEVVLPDGIERIESQAFAYSNLSRINLPSSLTYIDSSAFEGCWDTLFTGEENTYASSFCAYMGYPYVTYEVPVEEIRLQTDYIQMKVGETYNIITTVLPSNASQKKLNYYASDSSLSVTDTGTIYANEPGWSVVSIQTTDGSLRCVYLYVEIVDDLSISATADTRSIICNVTKPGGTIYIEGGVAPYSISYTWHADGYQNPQQVHWIDNINTDTVRWTCNPCNNHEGSFHVNITCTDSAGQTKTYTINGFNMRVDSTCTVSPVKVKVFTGERMTNGFKVTIDGNYGPYYLSLRIMKNNVTYDEITIDNVASQYTWIPDALSDAGTYELYCYCSDETTGGSGRYIATLEVVVPVSSITLDGTSHTLDVGDTYTLSSSVSPSNAANQTLRWTSSDTSVATVNSSGRITAKATGIATITATAADGSNVSASCTITVIQPTSDIISMLDPQYRPQSPVTYFTDDGRPCTHHGSGCSSTDDAVCNCKCYYNGRFLNSIQCKGYALYVQYKVYGYDEYNNSDYFRYLGGKKYLTAYSYDAETLRGWILKAGVGAHIRTSNQTVGVYHSLIVTNILADGFIAIEANYDNQCGIRKKYYTWQAFVDAFAKRGLDHIAYFCPDGT